MIYLRLTPNLLHLFQDLGALYAVRHGPNFYEIQVKEKIIPGLSLKKCASQCAMPLLLKNSCLYFLSFWHSG
jgi:hypothetical protein